MKFTIPQKFETYDHIAEDGVHTFESRAVPGSGTIRLQGPFGKRMTLEGSGELTAAVADMYAAEIAAAVAAGRMIVEAEVSSGLSLSLSVGLGSGYTAMPSPIDLVTDATVVGFWESDVGVNRTGSVVDSWTNQVGGGPAWTATGTARPTYLANDSVFNNWPSLAWEVTDDQMVTTLAAPAPGTTNRYYMIVAQNQGLAAGTGTIISGDGGTSHLIFRNGADAANQLSAYNTSFKQGAANFPLSGAARLIQMGLTNSTADFLTIGAEANKVTGTSMGNGSAASMRLGAYSGAAGFGNKKIVSVLICNGIPSQTIRDQLAARLAAKYGANLIA